MFCLGLIGIHTNSFAMSSAVWLQQVQQQQEEEEKQTEELFALARTQIRQLNARLRTQGPFMPTLPATIVEELRLTLDDTPMTEESSAIKKRGIKRQRPD